MARGDLNVASGRLRKVVTSKGYLMSRLEDLARGATVKGILSDSPVTIADVRWIGSNVIELTYTRYLARLCWTERRPPSSVAAHRAADEAFQSRRKEAMSRLTIAVSTLIYGTACQDF